MQVVGETSPLFASVVSLMNADPELPRRVLQVVKYSRAGAQGDDAHGRPAIFLFSASQGPSAPGNPMLLCTTPALSDFTPGDSVRRSPSSLFHCSCLLL